MQKPIGYEDKYFSFDGWGWGDFDTSLPFSIDSIRIDAAKVVVDEIKGDLEILLSAPDGVLTVYLLDNLSANFSTESLIADYIEQCAYLNHIGDKADARAFAAKLRKFADEIDKSCPLPADEKNA